MKIDQLPIELLIKIFSYQPTVREIALVNRHFYEIVTDLNDANICLRIDQRFYDRFFYRDAMGEQWLQSVQETKRKVSKLELRSMITSFFLDGPIFLIVEKFASYITTLKFADAFTKESVLVEILMMTPAVRVLDFQRFTIRQPRTMEERYHQGELNLKKLKSLTILSCGDEMTKLFHSLPVGVLSALKVASVEWKDLATLLNHQTSIKTLTLGRQCPIEHPGIVFFDNLKLESFQINGNEINHFTMAAILSKQTELKSLKFNAEHLVCKQVMDAVTELSELETLAMCAKYTSPERSFIDIRKLKKLKNLTLQCGNDTTALEILVKSKNTAMEVLTVDVFERIPTDLISELAKSAPNLKQLKIVQGQMFNGTDMNALLQHFNFVEVLDIPIWHEHFVDQVNYSNQMLMELTVTSTGAFSESWLTKLMSAYTNLRKLKLLGGFYRNSVKIQPILFGFTKLESLTLRAYKLIVEDLDYLLDHMHNLKFASLGGLGREQLSDMRLKKLRDRFGIANVHDAGILEVAIDRYTMNSNAS